MEIFDSLALVIAIPLGVLFGGLIIFVLFFSIKKLLMTPFDDLEMDDFVRGLLAVAIVSFALGIWKASW